MSHITLSIENKKKNQENSLIFNYRDSNSDNNNNDNLKNNYKIGETKQRNKNPYGN